MGLDGTLPQRLAAAPFSLRIGCSPHLKFGGRPPNFNLWKDVLLYVLCILPQRLAAAPFSLGIECFCR